MSEAIKRCRKCGEERPIEEFRLDDRYAGGRRQPCLACLTAYRNARRAEDAETARMWRKLNPERVKAYNQSRREQMRENTRRYYERHPDRRQAANEQRQARREAERAAHRAKWLRIAQEAARAAE